MIYFCKHYKDKVPNGKALKYCLKRKCWALKICRGITEFHKLKKQADNK